MTMEIDGENWEITPSVWAVFEDWYGDKAYRQAGFVAEFEAAVRKQVDAERSATPETSVRIDMESVIRAGGEWQPIGGGIEARTVESDLVGTIRLRHVGDTLSYLGDVHDVVEADLVDTGVDYWEYRVWVEPPVADDD
ncbi:hypothetical protein [Streptomyces albipurpureus]|uniref:Uncharacterized protein n=1 Tax=Streptomyces albipurpureus TaxID=2897419 RepID=A0ABT0UX52_9ACTN|nr:hypothetical protein [Streptomyces sp. CWNU-1]MCM2391751.1 hypothetical protein [Streptomyces sp. CWNU-1]